VESSQESTARTARFGGGYSGEGPAHRTGAVITGAACCCIGTDRGTTRAVSPGIGAGTGTAIGTTIGTDTTIGTGLAAGTGTTIGTGTGCTGRTGATIIRSRGTSPSSHGGTGPLYGGESGGP
ncbi:hypothetical protein KI387_017054, partial [Taxus chinensis]